jgi:hypothetical protein
VICAERLQILKKAHQLALDDSREASESHRRGHDAKAQFHDFKERSMAYIDKPTKFWKKTRNLPNVGLVNMW